MKRISSSLFITLLILTGAFTCQARAILVSGNPYAPPVVWEEHQNLVGLGPDLAADILTEIGTDFDFRRFRDWQVVQDKAKSGEIDLIVSAYRNNEREQYLRFSRPYLSQPTVIVVEKGREFNFSSWDVLKDKRGVSNVGESYGEEFDDFMQENLDITFHQLERAIQLVNLGEADFLIIDLYTALIYARLLQGEDSITILDPPVTIQNFHFAIRNDSPLIDQLDMINIGIKKRIDSGMVRDTLLQHFDKWKRLTEQRADYFARGKKARSVEQEQYLKEQDEMARQRIIRTMVNREGLPPAAQ
jgi:polar amino acid transport system substrate-binding protein